MGNSSLLPSCTLFSSFLNPSLTVLEIESSPFSGNKKLQTEYLSSLFFCISFAKSKAKCVNHGNCSKFHLSNFSFDYEPTFVSIVARNDSLLDNINTNIIFEFMRTYLQKTRFNCKYQYEWIPELM